MQLYKQFKNAIEEEKFEKNRQRFYKLLRNLDLISFFLKGLKRGLIHAFQN